MPNQPPRIVIAGFQHETNRFGATRAALSDFEMADSWPGMLHGEGVLEGLTGSTLPLWGFAEAARKDGAELIPIVWCAAEPSSFVTDSAYEHIAGLILDGIRHAGAIDGIYLDLHGAMVTESHADGEGELLSRLRALVGPTLPITISLDNHANISPLMVRQASTITAFRSYPHLDMDATGARCWPLMQALLAGARPVPSLRKAPFLIPLQAQFTGTAPLDRLYERIAAIGPAPSRWAELATGFPASDTEETGPAILAYAEDQASADALADSLMAELIKAEEEFDTGTLTPAQAVAEAIRLTATQPGAVVLADIEDNPGAGATSDTTGLLAALITGGARNAVLGMLDDAETAAAAHHHGIGARFQAKLGGKAGPDEPHACTVVVEALSDGRFDFSGEMYRGSTADAGPCALLLIEDARASVRVVVSSKRCQCLDQAIFRHIGIALEDQRIIAVKSSVHYRADFEPLATAVISVSSPGLNPCSLDQVPFSGLSPGIRLGPLGPAFGG